VEDWKLEPARDLGLPLAERLRSVRRESGLVESFAHRAWWLVIRSYLGLCHRLTILGREHVPNRPPFLLVANHSSHLDALVLAASMNGRLRDHVFPIAAGDTFFETPVLTAFAAYVLNALPLWRRNCGPHALAELRQRLVGEPCAFILFPEGTRSRDGRMATFKPGMGMIVAETAVPVVPCYLAGAFESLSADRRWPRWHKVTLSIGEPLVFESAKNDRAGWLEIARTTEAAVRQLSGESREPCEPS